MLNEKFRGASSSKLPWPFGQARCWEKVSVSASVELLAVAGDDLDLGHALGELQRRLEGVGEPALDALAPDEPVDDDLDRVLLVAGEVDLVAEVDEVAVDPGPGEALGGEVLEHALVGALAPPHHRRQHLEAGAVGQLEDAVDDLLGRLADDGRRRTPGSGARRCGPRAPGGSRRSR